MFSPDASGSARRGDGPEFTRVYRLRGRVAHLAGADGSLEVLCTPRGRVVYAALDNGWYGTGTQAEYEHAERLPLCRGCFAIRERQLPDGRLGAGHGEVMT